MKPSSLLVLLCVASCGGKIADGADGGSEAAATTPTSTPTTTPSSNPTPPPSSSADASPAPPPCGPHMGSGTAGPSGACDRTESYTCGSTTYEVDCSCAASNGEPVCVCMKDGTPTTKVIPTAFTCPGCSGSIPLVQCGFPQ